MSTVIGIIEVVLGTKSTAQKHLDLEVLERYVVARPILVAAYVVVFLP